jgi:hypothetical protein
MKLAMLTTAALLTAIPLAWGHGDAAWVMENPETRHCCGPQDCGPVRVYNGTVEEVGPGEWLVTIPPGTHPLVPDGASRVFREGDKNVYPSQRLEPYVCAYAGGLRCFFPEPMGF